MHTEVIQPTVTKTMVSAPANAGKAPNHSNAPDTAVIPTSPRNTGLTWITPRSDGRGLRHSAASGLDLGACAGWVDLCAGCCDLLPCSRSDSPGWKSTLVPV